MKFRHAVCAGIALSTLVGCGADGTAAGVGDSNEQTEEQGQPLATIELSATHRIVIREPAPGEFIYTEQAGPDDVPIEVDVTKPETLSGFYRRVSPDHQVPDFIAAATLREVGAYEAHLDEQIDVKPAFDLGGGESLAGDGIVAKEAPRRVSDFRDNECRTAGERVEIDRGPVTVDVAICATERTGDSWAEVSNVHAAQSSVYVYRGQLNAVYSYNFGNGWGTDGNLWISEGGLYKTWRFNPNSLFRYRLDITAASGDGYHRATFGSGSTNSQVMSCYDGGFHCGLWTKTIIN